METKKTNKTNKTITTRKGIIEIANKHRKAEDSYAFALFGEFKRIDIAIRYLKSFGFTITKINENKFEIK